MGHVGGPCPQEQCIEVSCREGASKGDRDHASFVRVILFPHRD